MQNVFVLFINFNLFFKLYSIIKIELLKYNTKTFFTKIII